MSSKDTLAEKNRIYQQRHRAKMREQKGIDKYREEARTYMQTYREERNKAEGYVKPEPVVRLAEPARKPPENLQKEIKLKSFNRDKKKTKKQENRLQLLKLNLKSKSLADKSLNSYIAKHIVMYKLFTGDTKSETMGGWKQEVLKALKNQTYDTGLHKVISYFRKIEEVVSTLKKEQTKPNVFKSYIGAITALLGRLDGFDAEYEYASNLGVVLQKEYTEVRDLNELSAEELVKINKIQFDDKSIAENIKKLTNLKDKALYATYMYIPRRLEISTVRIRSNDKNTDKSGNYLILRNTIPDRFIFNEYKTSDKYKRQVVDVPEQIKPVLHEYILERKLESGNVLFPLARSKSEVDSNFSKTFTNVFNQVYDEHNNKKRRTRLENFTNQDLRTAYATYWIARAKNTTDKKIISNALSHSFEINEHYNKTNVKKE